MPGTSLGRARTNSAINNTQASGYIRANGGSGAGAGYIGAESPCSTETSRAEASAVQYGASRHCPTNERYYFTI